MLGFYATATVALSVAAALALLWPRISVRWQFERRWTARKCSIRFVNESLQDTFDYLTSGHGINVVGAEPPDYWQKTKVTMTLSGATGKQVFLKALEGTGLDYRVYSPNTVVVYRPGSRNYAAFRAGGLRWRSASSETRKAMSEVISLAQRADASAALESLARRTGLRLEADRRLLEGRGDLRLNLNCVTVEKLWDLSLRLSGLVGEVQGDRIRIREVEGVEEVPGP